MKTSVLYAAYTVQMKLCAIRPISAQEFVGEAKKRYHVKHDYKLGNVILDAKLANL